MKASRNEKPLIFGYYSARPGVSTEQTMTMSARLTAFAIREGYALAGMFIEPSEQPAVALQAMIESAQRRQVEAVAIPALSDLGTDPITQRVTRERLEAVGLRVLVVVGGAA